MINSYKWCHSLFPFLNFRQVGFSILQPYLAPSIFVCPGARVCGGQVDGGCSSVTPPSLLFRLNLEFVSVAGVRYACDFPMDSLLSVLYWLLDISSFCPLA